MAATAMIDAPRPLSGWYAEPMAGEAAERLRRAAEAKALARARRGLPCLTCRLARLVAGFWCGENPRPAYQTALHAAGARRGRALTELIYGQLLTSRRLPGGAEHLAAGFTLAVPLLAPADYFTLVNRHARLARLPAGPGQPAAGLAELLAVAAVVARLEQASPSPPVFRHDPRDTYG